MGGVKVWSRGEAVGSSVGRASVLQPLPLADHAKAVEAEGEHLEARQRAREAEPRHIRRSLGQIVLAHVGRLRTPALLQAEPRERALGENARQVE